MPPLANNIPLIPSDLWGAYTGECDPSLFSDDASFASTWLTMNGVGVGIGALVFAGLACPIPALVVTLLSLALLFTGISMRIHEQYWPSDSPVIATKTKQDQGQPSLQPRFFNSPPNDTQTIQMTELTVF